MITYLILSTLSMAILLLFYHAVLEKEKMHRISRGYLVFSLVFSLLIPMIPIGLPGSYVPWVHSFLSAENQPNRLLTPANGGPDASATEMNGSTVAPKTGWATSSVGWITQLFLLVYFAVAFLLLVRLLRNVAVIRMKVRRSPCQLFENHKVVLLSERVVPHTFMTTIFMNRAQYRNGEIGREVLLHELTHARQMHTVDILFVELLKILFWFNPLLHFYKKAMQLNHEFLADEAVVSDGNSVPAYQSLLLNTITAQPSNRLVSTLNYSMTKKRFIMMTQTTSRLRTFLKTTALLPLFTAMGMLLGCEPTTSEYKVSGEKITVEIAASETISVDGQEMHVSEFGEYLARSQASETEFQLHIHPDAPVGVVYDVTKLMYKYNRSGKPHPKIKFINLEVDDAKAIKLQGANVTIDELEKELADLNSVQYLIVDILTDASVPTDHISSIQDVLRTSGVDRINYQTVRGEK